MSFVLVASGTSFAALADRPVVKRDQVRPLRDAAALLAEAESRLGSVDDLRSATRAEAEADGYAAGLAAGREAAALEAAAGLKVLQTALKEERERLRASVGRLALDVVRRIAAELGPDATVAALAQRAVREVLPEQPLTVRVHPDCAGTVSARLWPLGATIEVQGDPALSATDCVLETPQGKTVASLETQLSALERLFAVEMGDDRAVA